MKHWSGWGLVWLLFANLAWAEGFSLVSDEQMNKMGVQAFEEIKKNTPIEKDPAINAYVNCVVQPIIDETNNKAKVKKWEIVVFRSKEINAFALPGGKIGVYTGLLKIAENQSQLATVLGHEVGHVLAKHGSKRVSQNMMVQGGLQVFGMVAGERLKNRDLWMGALGLGAQFGILLPHSRNHESEADQIGLKLMSKAGFNPQESVTLWQNMSRASKGQPLEFMSTHPSHQTRIEELNGMMADALLWEARAHSAGNRPQCEPPPFQ